MCKKCGFPLENEETFSAVRALMDELDAERGKKLLESNTRLFVMAVAASVIEATIGVDPSETETEDDVDANQRVLYLIADAIDRYASGRFIIE